MPDGKEVGTTDEKGEGIEIYKLPVIKTVTKI